MSKIRCLGRNAHLNRCGRFPERGRFCGDHRRQPLIWLFSILSFVGLIAGLYQDLWKELIWLPKANEPLKVPQKSVNPVMHPEPAKSIEPDQQASEKLNWDDEIRDFSRDFYEEYFAMDLKERDRYDKDNNFLGLSFLENIPGKSNIITESEELHLKLGNKFGDFVFDNTISIPKFGSHSSNGMTVVFGYVTKEPRQLNQHKGRIEEVAPALVLRFSHHDNTLPEYIQRTPEELRYIVKNGDRIENQQFSISVTRLTRDSITIDLKIRDVIPFELQIGPR